ncbi:MAG TPA: restriction endonuclease [Solirubrobacterales bacterium]|nr:restriction endonuclease [Solirubrobacterales bacterium]
MPVESAELSLGELRTAIAARPERATQLPPRRFEELVGDVFANEGYRVELTQSTRDGGRDLIVLRESDEIEAIVEVKRHKKRVGVDLVRQLRGVQIRDNVPYAILVATMGFSKDAQAEAAAGAPEALGFTLDLYDIDELMRAMDTLAEPVESPAAIERSRERYRAWLRENLRERATPPESLFDADAAWGD